jgi:hypothetical protein
MRGQPVAVGQRFGEMLAGVEEQHGRCRVDLRHLVQQHRAFRAKAGDDRRAPATPSTSTARSRSAVPAPA